MEKEKVIVNEKELKEQKKLYDDAAAEAVVAYQFYQKAQKKAANYKCGEYPDIHAVYEMESCKKRYEKAYARWYKEAVKYEHMNNINEYYLTKKFGTRRTMKLFSDTVKQSPQLMIRKTKKPGV